MKRFLNILSGCAAAALLFGALAAVPSAAASSGSTLKRGLHVEEDGTITLTGKAFYGYGENYFGAFAHYVGTDYDTKPFVEGFKAIADAGIPFVRLPLCGWDASYYDLWDSDRDGVFKYMDAVIDEAAKDHIGVIVSLMWWESALTCHLGAKRSDLGKTDSETMKYAKDYVSAVVEHFKDSPAVWGWEIGNEYNLDADLCDRNFQDYLWSDGIASMPKTDINGFDYYSSAELQTFYTEIAKTIREIDPYRLITTGNGEMRAAAAAMHKASDNMDTSTHTWDIDWTEESYDDFIAMNAYYTPDPIDCVCFHLQNGTSGSSSPAYIFSHKVFGKTVTTEDYFKAYAAAAKACKKGLFFGEFGDFIDMENDPTAADSFRSLVGWIEDSGIQIGCAWHYQDVSTDGINGEKMAILGEVNAALQEEHKQSTSLTWLADDSSEQTQDTTASETVYVTAAETETAKAYDPEAEKASGHHIAAIAAVICCLIAVAGAGAAAWSLNRQKKGNKSGNDASKT